MSHDLHSHTTASDGLLTSAQLIRDARDAGIETLAITDHDTLAGIEAAVQESLACGIKLIPGIEISARAGKQNLHLLGYFPSHEAADIGEFQDRQRQLRYQRILQIIARLRDLGFDLSEDDVLGDVADDCTVGRPHVARALVQKGHVKTTREAFDELIGDDAPAHVDSPRLQAADAVAMVRERGGLTSVAHPLIDGLAGSLQELRDCGVDAIEVFHPSHRSDGSRRLIAAAKELNMLVTGGSDYHGASIDGGGMLGQVTLPAEHYHHFARALERT